MSKFIQFACNLETFIDDLKKIIQKNEKKVQELLKQENKTYKNFVKVLEENEEKLELFFTPLSHLNSVNNSEETQKVYANALPIVTEYSTKLSQNLELYNAYKEILEKEKKSLTKEQLRVLELNIQAFELSGANLDEESKKRLAEINLRKSELQNDFSQNLLDATNAYEKIIENEEDVKGIPQSDLELAKFEEDGKIKYKFTLQLPSYIAYMTYGPNRKIREELYKAYVTRAPQNEKIIDELLALRDESSKILGFENYAEYSLATKMASSTNEVLEFLDELKESSISQAKEEVKELKKEAGFELKSWDSAYYSEKLRKKTL